MGTALDGLLQAADFAARDCEIDPIDPQAAGLLTPALHPLLNAAAQLFTQAHPVTWLPGARRGLSSSLARRWLACIETVVHAGSRAAGVAPAAFIADRLATRAQWERLLRSHPGVAELMDGSLQTWRREITRLGQRLVDDAATLGLTLPIAVAELTVHAGEHEGRRWTLSLALADGRRLIYRTRDLRIVPWFMRVCALLNESLSTPLHVRRVVAARDHAWDEHIARAPCRDRAEATRFYRRIGVLMRLCQLLRATDIHVKNVIGAGEHPVIIDVETLLQPSRDDSALERARLGTPLETGLLPFFVVGDPGRRAVDGSALGHGGLVTMPYRVPCLVAPDSPQAAFTRDYAPPRPAPSILPILDGELQPPGAHIDAILDGYAELDEILAREDRLDPLLAEAAELPVRTFVRANIVYRRAQFDSLAPELLRDPERRRRALWRMLAGPDGERAAADAMLRAEVAALADLRLPRFVALPGSDALVCPDGTSIAGYFAAGALARIERRQPEAQRRRNLDCIRSAIALVDADTPAPPRRPTRAQPIGDAALRIADLILDEAIPDRDELHFIGTAWLPWAAARVLGPLPHDILSGNGGLAIVLAAAHRKSGLPRFAAASRAALAPIRRGVERELPSLEAWARDPGRYPARWLFCGAFHGWGAHLIALARCRALLDEGADPLAADLLRCFPLPLAPRAPRDLAIGLPGFLLAAMMLGPLPATLLPLVDRLHELVDPPFPDGTPAFLPPPELSVALARVRAAKPATSAAGPLIYRYACDPSCAAEAAAALAQPASLELLELALSDERWATRAAAIADELVRRHAETGRWLEGAVADRHHLSALTGLGALALALLRVEMPSLGSLRLLQP